MLYKGSMRAQTTVILSTPPLPWLQQSGVRTACRGRVLRPIGHPSTSQKVAQAKVLDEDVHLDGRLHTERTDDDVLVRKLAISLSDMCFMRM